MTSVQRDSLSGGVFGDSSNNSLGVVARVDTPQACMRFREYVVVLRCPNLMNSFEH